MNATLWILNTIGLLATTVGVLIVFLHLHRTSQMVSDAVLPEICRPLLKDRRVLEFCELFDPAKQYLAILFT